MILTDTTCSASRPCRPPASPCAAISLSCDITPLCPHAAHSDANNTAHSRTQVYVHGALAPAPPFTLLSACECTCLLLPLLERRTSSVWHLDKDAAETRASTHAGDEHEEARQTHAPGGKRSAPNLPLSITRMLAGFRSLCTTLPDIHPILHEVPVHHPAPPPNRPPPRQLSAN